MIYLDNSATTRPNEACVAAMNELLTECWFNPSSVYRPGMDAAHRLKTARAQVAQALSEAAGFPCTFRAAIEGTVAESDKDVLAAQEAAKRQAQSNLDKVFSAFGRENVRVLDE